MRRRVSVPNFIRIVFGTFPVLHPFFSLFLEKHFTESVSWPYGHNFTLLDSNLTNSMKSKIFMVVNIKVFRFDILSKWKSYNLQYLGMIQKSVGKKTRSSHVLVWSSHKQILNFFIFSSKKKYVKSNQFFTLSWPLCKFGKNEKRPISLLDLPAKTLIFSETFQQCFKRIFHLVKWTISEEKRTIHQPSLILIFSK